MKRQHLLAPVVAATLAALGSPSLQAATTSGYNTTWQNATAVRDTTPLTREQVRRELAAAREAHWQGFGSEETVPQEQFVAARSREEVVAELNEWRAAGAIDPYDNEGAEQRVHERRMALHQQQVQRYAAAQEAEQMRLAREREAEAQRLAQAAAQQSDAATAATGPTGVGASGTTAVDVSGSATASGETSATLGAPAPTPMPADPQAPPRQSPDAAIDSTRPRSTVDSLTATPQPVPERPLNESRPLDGSARPADASQPPMTTPPPAQ